MPRWFPTQQPSSPVVPVNVRVVPTELRAVRSGAVSSSPPSRPTGTFSPVGKIATSWGPPASHHDMRPGVVLYPTLEPPQALDRYLARGTRQRGAAPAGFIEARTGGTFRGGFNLYPVLVRENQVAGDRLLGYRDLTSGVGLDRRSVRSARTSFTTSRRAFRSPTADALPEGFKKVVISYVDVATNLDLRDDPLHPHKGLFIGNDFQFAGIPVTPNFRSAGDLFPRSPRAAGDARLHPHRTRVDARPAGHDRVLVSLPGATATLPPGVTRQPTTFSSSSFAGSSRAAPIPIGAILTEAWDRTISSRSSCRESAPRVHGRSRLAGLHGAEDLAPSPELLDLGLQLPDRRSQPLGSVDRAALPHRRTRRRSLLRRQRRLSSPLRPALALPAPVLRRRAALRHADWSDPVRRRVSNSRAAGARSQFHRTGQSHSFYAISLGIGEAF